MSFNLVPNPRGGTGRKMRTGKARSSIFDWGVDRLAMFLLCRSARPAMDGESRKAGRYDRWQGRPVRSQEHKENIRNDESRARRLVLGHAMQACALRSAVDEGSRLGCITKPNSSPCVNLARVDFLFNGNLSLPPFQRSEEFHLIIRKHWLFL